MICLLWGSNSKTERKPESKTKKKHCHDSFGNIDTFQTSCWLSKSWGPSQMATNI